ncbi:hypothetical protein DMH04_45050 [Kibdelosporangium aridum]|uniref:Uncharacterized protein n=1 Tax=Kibdelosporangium aridum TaxID=2030 RepID=A0A428YPB2_KIBAR|nr:hypothetical protein [Kibdelosporangium aridum]RSM70300.1 hypothetical protein DMH04_45050 [Kibdelosporangium aridum]
MTSDIGYALFLGSMGLIILCAIVTMIVPRRRNDQDQRTAATDFFGAATGPALEFDWFRFGDVPKQDLIKLADQHGWRFDSDQVTDNAWILRFTKSA